MKNIIFVTLLTLSFNTLAAESSAKASKADLIAKKPTDAQILQLKIFKAFKEKRTFYKA